MLELSDYFLTAIFTSLLYFSIWFLFGVANNRFDFIDVAWGGGFIAVTVALLAIDNNNLYYVQKLVLVLVAVWGFRLMWHILMRNLKKKEDARYVAMHSKWKKHKKLNIFFRIYMVQALLLILVALPIIATFSATDPFNNQILLGVGFFIWAVGFCFEFFADKQLSNFINYP